MVRMIPRRTPSSHAGTENVAHGGLDAQTNVPVHMGLMKGTSSG